MRIQEEFALERLRIECLTVAMCSGPPCDQIMCKFEDTGLHVARLAHAPRYARIFAEAGMHFAAIRAVYGHQLLLMTILFEVKEQMGRAVEGGRDPIAIASSQRGSDRGFQADATQREQEAGEMRWSAADRTLFVAHFSDLPIIQQYLQLK